MKKIILLLSLFVFIISCNEDNLDTENNDKLTLTDWGKILAADPSKADLLMIANYDLMNNFGGTHDEFGIKAIDLGTDLMTQDIVQSIHHWFGFYYLVDNRLETYRSTTHMWIETLAKMANGANAILRPIDKTTTNPEARAIIGQAYGFRAYTLLYYIHLFQKAYSVDPNLPGVPLFDDDVLNDRPGRNTTQAVYDQIIKDLNSAYSYLDGYTRPAKGRIDRSVVAGLLARTYLDMENWQQAAAWAATARTGYSLMNQTQYKSGFADITNPEVMFGYDINATNTNYYASYFSQISNQDQGYAGLLGVYKLIDRSLYDKIPATDYRKTVFNGSSDAYGLPAYASLKFFSNQADFSGDLTFMRASEMYLIEAEAKAHYDEAGAKQVLLQFVSQRNPSYTLSSNSGQALIDEILTQRQIELWGEGFRLNDLKRLNLGIDRNYAGTNHRSDARLTIPAQDVRWVFQIPIAEINSSDFLSPSDQNP